MQSRRGRFTVAEDHVLRQKYALVPTARLASLLHRNPAGIDRRAKELFSSMLMKTGTWSPEDITQLKVYYGASQEVPLSLVLRREPDDIERFVAQLKKHAKGKREPLTRPQLVWFKRWYGNRTIEDLCVVFVREADMLEELAESLCLKKDKAFVRSKGGNSKMPRWTADEVVVLSREYPETSNTALAQRLGRSVKSVVSKAHNLGLKKSAGRLEEMGRQNVRGRYEK